VKRYILFRLFAIQLAVIFVLLVAGLVAARGTGRGALVWWAAFVAILGAGVVSYLVARSTVRPMRDLTTAFRKLSGGDFDARVMPVKRGRLHELGDDFNQMAFRTKTLFAELRQRREALDAIVGSIQEGLVVVDNSGRIVMANASFRQLTSPLASRPSPLEGRYYWEVIREPAFIELVRSVTPDRQTAAGQFELAGRDYACSASFLPAAQQVVLTFHDNSEVTRSARIKKDFVQNVSHELRTPLTAIKGFAETMQPTIDSPNRPYLETIIRNTDRLVSLVQDLLTLSELEERGTELQLEDIDLEEVTRQVFKLFEPRAKSKGLDLRLSVSSPQPPAPSPQPLLLHADRFRLEQVLINLLDNAVKFTERGQVEVAIARGETTVAIEVRDTGPGIAADHLPRLFERFYVVDKGRSRQLGGTGLGLAIVKHIVLLHGGDVTVKSTPGAGTTFTVTLPVVTA